MNLRINIFLKVFNSLIDLHMNPGKKFTLLFRFAYKSYAMENRGGRENCRVNRRNRLGSGIPTLKPGCVVETKLQTKISKPSAFVLLSVTVSPLAS
jgi:hypothetical protein